MDITSFIDDINKNHWNIHGLELYRDGSSACRWGDTTTRYPIYSATKSITAIAVGMAADGGALDIEKPVTDYLPAALISKMSTKQKAAYSFISTRRLMTMSVAGYPFRPEGESWLTTVLSYPLENTERAVFDYSNIPAYLAGVAASCALGEDLYDYLDRRLFQPLGIIGPPCGRCPDGYFYGASRMELSVNELSRIGILLCCGGTYDGQRIVSEEYVRAMTSVHQPNREGGYGYFVWKCRGGFTISGKWKQKCYVLPKSRVVLTFLSHIEDDVPDLSNSIERNILDS